MYTSSSKYFQRGNGILVHFPKLFVYTVTSIVAQCNPRDTYVRAGVLFRSCGAQDTCNGHSSDLLNRYTQQIFHIAADWAESVLCNAVIVCFLYYYIIASVMPHITILQFLNKLFFWKYKPTF